MFDTISIGSATLDVFLKSAQFTVKEESDGEEYLQLLHGSKMNAEDFALQSGGGATNTAVGLSRLGLRSSVIAELGTDLPAKVIIAELQEENVDTSLLIQEPDENTAISALLIDSSGDRSVVTARGAAYMLTPDDLPLAKMKAHWIHISSIGNTEVVKTIAQHCKKHRIRFSWNPGGKELKAIENGSLHLTEIYPDTLFLNEEEAEIIRSAGYDLETGGSRIVITEGERGGQYYEHGTWNRFDSQPTEIVQATGAGDAFATGVIAATLHDRLSPEAMQWGAKNAASVVRSMGAKTGLLRQSDFPKI
ncbi:carbohydrate kinase family protein [Candidatus Woesebacteria bacterium]|nr:carbohydrate kinase family protein [Candidatus Woesebacteria bacterium]MCD8527271.1 carbohydrate kinase family protein [Candidatus Woesebacteria bacterium]MCD8546637.1 carbohydrate kinase family protein [Candidatus Woesebacteria bacterium]